MDQFRQIGEVVGSLKALMVLKHDIPINQRQCCLLSDMYILAFETISEEIRQSLRLDERSTKWRTLEFPMRELHRIMREGEQYIRHCLEIKDWWGKAISLHLNRDSIDFHIHNLLCCFPIVIEAIETAAEISVPDQDDMHKRRGVIMKKYDSCLNDPKLFQWMYGKQYLVPREICSQIDNAVEEDKWLLRQTITEKKRTFALSLTKQHKRVVDFLLTKLNEVEVKKPNLLGSSVLFGTNDYYVKRRIGLGEGHVKEIQWLGESFALKTFFGEMVPPMSHDISQVLSLSHPNILQYLCGFYDEEKKEGFLLMELMSKNLSSHIKENCGQRKSLPFSLPAAVDIMLQVARGMEYLHSRKIYHGDLNPSNILLRPRSSPAEGYFHAKVCGFSFGSVKTSVRCPAAKAVESVIWYAPEVLAEKEQADPVCTSNSKYSEKADVYSFGMLCFEVLTGKVPFEDNHLQGDKIVRNISVGGRPLFPYPSPKYLANLTRKCWHPIPDLRPSFASICRILRYIKKTLIINPDHGNPESPPPLVDYCDIEVGYSMKFPGEGNLDLAPVTQIPFQLYAYKLIEKEKISKNTKDKSWDYLFGGDGHLAAMDDLFLVPSDVRSVHSEIIETRSSVAPLDQRSVVSENADFKLFSSDPRSADSDSQRRKSLLVIGTKKRISVSSGSPGKEVPLAVAVDHSCPRPAIAERRVSPLTPTSHESKLLENNPEPEMRLSPEHQKTADSKTSSDMKAADERQVNNHSKSSGKEHDQTAPDRGLHSAGTSSGRKVQPRRRVHGRKLSEIPEKTIPVSLSKQNPIPFRNAGKRSEPTTPGSSKSARVKNSDKKTSLNKRHLDANTANGSGISRGGIARSSSAPKQRAFSSPAATPSRASLGSSLQQGPREHSSPLNTCSRYSRSKSNGVSSSGNRLSRASTAATVAAVSFFVKGTSVTP